MIYLQISSTGEVTNLEKIICVEENLDKAFGDRLDDVINDDENVPKNIHQRKTVSTGGNSVIHKQSASLDVSTNLIDGQVVEENLHQNDHQSSFSSSYFKAKDVTCRPRPLKGNIFLAISMNNSKSKIIK